MVDLRVAKEYTKGLVGISMVGGRIFVSDKSVLKRDLAIENCVISPKANGSVVISGDALHIFKLNLPMDILMLYSDENNIFSSRYVSYWTEFFSRNPDLIDEEQDVVEKTCFVRDYFWEFWVPRKEVKTKVTTTAWLVAKERKKVSITIFDSLNAASCEGFDPRGFANIVLDGYFEDPKVNYPE